MCYIPLLIFCCPVVRFQSQLAQHKERSLHYSSGVETQASKRQKLEGGHLHKVQKLCRPMLFLLPDYILKSSSQRIFALCH